MAPAALEAELLRRLAARDDRQAACFEELALLFACQQDKLVELERAAQSKRASTLGSGADGDGPREDAQGGEGRPPDDGQGKRDEQQNERLQHEKQQKQDGTQKFEGEVSAATPPAAGSSTLTPKESGKTKAIFPKTSFELQRELLRVRNEGSALKASLTDTRERLRQERAQHLRVKDELKATQELLQATQNELRALRSQHKHTEEKYLDIYARNHDLEVRIVDEKRKVAETLNAMNEMIQSQQTRGGSHKGATFDVAAIMTPASADESTAKEDAESPPRGAQQSAKAWTSNVGVQLPTDWRVVAEASGVSVVSLAYNDDGTILVAGGSDGILRLWSPQFYNELSRSESVRQPILCVDMKSRYILGTCDRSCYVWQVEGPGSPPVLLHRLSGGHTGSVVAGRLTPDCRYAATGGRKIKIWDMATGDVVRTVDCMSKCLALDVNEQGSLLVSGHADKGVRLWDMRTGQRAGVVTSLHTNPLTSVSFSSKGNIVTVGMDNRLAILDQAKLGEEPPRYLTDREYRANQWWCKACVSPGIFTSGSLLVAAGSKAGSLFIWDLNSLSNIYTEQAHAQPITCVVWSPTGSQLASVDASGAIVCWNATGR